MSSGRLRGTFLSNRDKVLAGYKPLYLALSLPLLIQSVELNLTIVR